MLSPVGIAAELEQPVTDREHRTNRLTAFHHRHEHTATRPHVATVRRWWLSTADGSSTAGASRSPKAAPPHDTLGFDDFAEAQLTDPAQIVEVFTRQFSSGCEADHPLNALAFDRKLLPHGARLNAMFASDIGHWDVPDMRDVLVEAWELVDDGLLDEDEFRDFTCGNTVRMLTAGKPDFFAGTAVEGAMRPFVSPP